MILMGTKKAAEVRTNVGALYAPIDLAIKARVGEFLAPIYNESWDSGIGKISPDILEKHLTLEHE